ncbi:MAG: hypothetical protein COX77_01985 [Candidatus Komeilibacteria bacterium CG_4_10_14_0_2_um_filter_37_10]|uniref:Uncharacterized protein n=1 Tax=Candidatus Komeilibacteria bacterium CG_4_10_14_0_2_um_filter_37_10 TaxID=1974470 RepID=A0A2M7VFG5_9BACT|nr:MAG: hypothetical protein COX77_01985 [Candidatus Komeilibacteria bacterium CG_4_10_14_0_2_um_filter_37_10]
MFNFFVVLLICSLVTIAYLVYRHFSQLRIIHPLSSPRVQQAITKKEIYEQRLLRMGRQFAGQGRHYAVNIFQDSLSLIAKLYNIAYKKEESYRHKLWHQDLKNSVDQDQRISHLMIECQDLLDQEKFDLAEAKIIDILKIDPKNIEAYQKLGRLYRTIKQYDQAIEVYNYLLRVASNAHIYADLAAIAEERGDLKEAEKNYLAALQQGEQQGEYYFNLAVLYKQQENFVTAQEYVTKALELNGNNPRHLDFLIQVSIINRDKKAAQAALGKLIEVNSDNNKIVDYQEQIAIL